ncbi:MAG: SufE family protein [Alphaproteobacteria bacterium]|nr:SufE family protein [Alphaproteobacteria bacterium]
MNTDELIENFELLDDWEEKYRYLIDLGAKLPVLEEKFKTAEWLVAGCQSQVWLVPSVERERMFFSGDSDAMIVKGLIFVVLNIYNGHTKEEIKQIAAEDILKRMGLSDHLSPSRRNGLAAMIAKIKLYAGA